MNYVIPASLQFLIRLSMSISLIFLTILDNTMWLPFHTRIPYVPQDVLL